MNFYQSEVWRKINEDIYKKPIFEIRISDKNYWGIVKEKKLGIFTIRWFQLLWLKVEEMNEFWVFIENLKKDYRWFWNILFQIWFVDKIVSWDTRKFNDERIIFSVKDKVDRFISSKIKSYGMIKALRENMPSSTVIIDLTISKEDLYKNMIWSARNHYNKAKRKWLYFKLAENREWKQFYDLWKKTSLLKWFNIIPEKQFFELKEFLLWENKGNLFLVKLKDEIVSGSICLFIDNNIVYLYGATNRQLGNIGGHQFLKLEMFLRGKDNGFKLVDLLWSCRPWEVDCNLFWVSKFKWSLGGTQIEYPWSYDIILDNNLYKLFSVYKKIRKFL